MYVKLEIHIFNIHIYIYIIVMIEFLIDAIFLYTYIAIIWKISKYNNIL